MLGDSQPPFQLTPEPSLHEHVLLSVQESLWSSNHFLMSRLMSLHF
ncbi:hypothetical protein DsansV1_C01g0011601 [Dioscorea sansibarensis]